ncbi:PDR/VanB family oxidoreductase [Nocardia altamirensis]|uniref:PDR/VanB family oxidoreductase n=1 Tax=Nocardia altamirensis TaxID=472158 RepID=UPI000B178701|nr:PDR/VanB family oxidoreductase [Nocardia altamirensis]
MSSQTRTAVPTTPTPSRRNARIVLSSFAFFMLVAAVLPPLFPPTIAWAHRPMSYLLAALSAGLALLITVRPATPRTVLLTIGWVLVIATVLQAFAVGDVVAMFGTWLVVPALALLAGQLRPRGRKVLLAAHVLSGALWAGIGLTVCAMAVAAMHAGDVRSSAAIYELMAVFDITLLPWANFATILTGLALGLTTGWGLLRYYWVAGKMVIAVGILMMAFGFVHDTLEVAGEQAEHLAATGGTTADLTSAADVVLWSFVAATLGLVVAILLSLYKPGGRTRRGRRLLPAKSIRQPERKATVADMRPIADDTVALTLRAEDGAPLPTWAPGAHIDVVLPSGRVRQYSLYGDPADADSYRIAVLREPNGRGGSNEIHAMPVGTTIGIRGPRNNFPLVDATAYLFVAGGIGITPFLPMIDRLERASAPWQLLYRGRSLSSMAFATALRHQYPGHVALLPSDAHPRPDLAEVLGKTPTGVAVYGCGPQGLLDALEAAMATQCPHGTLQVERFAATERTAENLPFEAELRRSGVVVPVPTDRTLLAAIEDIVPTIDRSCVDGICGSCATRVLTGRPDHRDDVLQPGERERTDIIYPCVSRAHGKRIVLDV